VLPRIRKDPSSIRFHQAQPPSFPLNSHHLCEVVRCSLRKIFLPHVLCLDVEPLTDLSPAPPSPPPTMLHVSLPDGLSLFPPLTMLLYVPQAFRPPILLLTLFNGVPVPARHPHFIRKKVPSVPEVRCPSGRSLCPPSPISYPELCPFSSPGTPLSVTSRRSARPASPLRTLSAGLCL